MNLPIQSPPVSRQILSGQNQDAGAAAQNSQEGVTPSATPCDHLRGLAQQMCYAVKYGVSI
jgi:hypothetical protein